MILLIVFVYSAASHNRRERMKWCDYSRHAVTHAHETTSNTYSKIYNNSVYLFRVAMSNRFATRHAKHLVDEI